MKSRLCIAIGLLICAGEAFAQSLTRDEKEEFLRTAKVVRTASAPKGITGVLRATLQSEDGSITHDAAIQRIDESKREFRTDRGTEINFRDSYKFNLAAYGLARLLDLDMIPPHVERRYEGANASFAWWVEEVILDAGSLKKSKSKPPDPNIYNAQYSMVQIFDQLIYNVDRNEGNLLITKDWKLWMIDHTRAFRLFHELENSKVLRMCERHLLDRLKALDEHTLQQELGRYLNRLEITGLMKRRDRIVAFFEKAGPKALYTYAARR